LKLNLTVGEKKADGHSLIQRIIYWKGALKIIGDNVWFGTGTGDVDQAFKEYYESTDTGLSTEFQHRAHNQFLSIMIAFGVVGLLWFILSLIFPLIWVKRLDYGFYIFTIITVLSFLWEDTLETQAGVSFYAFFNCFYLFARKD